MYTIFLCCIGLFEKREQYNSQFKRDNFMYDTYIYFISHTLLSTHKKKKICSFHQKNKISFLEIVRWYINFDVHYLWKYSRTKCDSFFHFSSKRHQPMPWSLYIFKIHKRVLHARETFEEKHWFHRANTHPEYIKKYIISIASLY